MSRIGLVFVFLLTTLVAAIVLLPASFVVERAQLSQRGFSYQHVSGTIWNARIDDLAFGLQPIGDVELVFVPQRLFRGEVAANITINGSPGRVSGQSSLGLNRVVTFRDVVGDIQLQTLLALHDQMRTAPSQLSVSVVELKTTTDLTCLQGTMRLRTDLVREIGERWQWSGPVLDGTVACDSGAFRADIRSESNADDTIESTAMFDARTGLYDAVATIETQNTSLQNALIALGFAFEGAIYTYTRTNRPSPETAETTETSLE